MSIFADFSWIGKGVEFDYEARTMRLVIDSDCLDKIEKKRRINISASIDVTLLMKNMIQHQQEWKLASDVQGRDPFKNKREIILF